MGAWLYPISKRSDSTFDLVDEKVKVSINSYKELIANGRITEDRWWHVSMRYDDINIGDEVFIYTGDKDLGIIGYCTVNDKEVSFEGNRKLKTIELIFHFEKCKMLIESPVSAEIVRGWFNPRNAVMDLKDHAEELHRLLPWGTARRLEDKVARICWNTEIWRKPSGKLGKSRNKKAYESKTGYGHEEWLLDTEKLIGGFHYSYLQAIGAHYDLYREQDDTLYNISLYSIDHESKSRWWIGEIKNVEVISPDESKRVYSIYKEKGWLKEMIVQLQAVSANIIDFKNIPSFAFSNIRFRPSDVELLDTPRQFLHTDQAVRSDYYNLKNKVANPVFLEPSFEFNPGHNPGKATSVASYNETKKEVDLFHNSIQSLIYHHLVAVYGERFVGSEQGTGHGSRIDMVVKAKNKDNEYIFYEIKTSNSIRQCIRDALTQLLEYSYFPDRELASKMVIVSQNKIDKNNTDYLKLLRSKFRIPVYYQQFNVETNLLEPEI